MQFIIVIIQEKYLEEAELDLYWDKLQAQVLAIVGGQVLMQDWEILEI